MNCEEVELELSAGEPSVEVRAHVTDCAACQATARVLGLAALPPLSQTERLVLNGLAATTQQAWKGQRQRGQGMQRWATLALAAGLGGLLTSAVLHQPTSGPVAVAEQQVRNVLVSYPELPVLEYDEANLSDDEVFFEVSWPSPTEGDL